MKYFVSHDVARSVISLLPVNTISAVKSNHTLCIFSPLALTNLALGGNIARGNENDKIEFADINSLTASPFGSTTVDQLSLTTIL